MSSILLPDPQLRSILVIEDDHDTRVSLRQNLEREGYYVFSAANGRQGLELLKRIKPPCLILLDVVMPLMNGAEFIAAIKSDPVMHLIPVVLVSAFPDIAKTLVAKEFLQKPINLSVLLDIVSRHCPNGASSC
jgi:two-component system chemotaxis response regulator CheY